MIEHHLGAKKLDAVQPLLDELQQLPRRLEQKVTDLLAEQSSLQHELERYREDQIDANPVPCFRSTLLVGMLGSLMMLLYYLFQIDEVDPNALSPELLFFSPLAHCTNCASGTHWAQSSVC